MTNHPDLEALSAAVDGEDPAGAVASHARTCAGCRAQLDGMRSARRAVAAPVPPLATDAREAMIAAALAAAAEPAPAPAAPGPGPGPAAPAPPAAVVPLPARRDPRRWWAAGGAVAAAVMALVVGAAGMLGRGGDERTDTALGGGAVAESESPTAAAAPPAGAGDRVVDAGNLGDVASVEALRARFVATPLSARGESSTGTARSASDSLAAAAPTSAPVAREVGTRPCEEQARTARPQVGGLVYVATGRFAGTPAVFLGFAASAEGPPATVLVLAESGCRLLAETSVP